jgi:histidine triad (HIT) family protein
VADRDPGCLFCRLVAGEIPADVLRRSDRTLAFRDVNPQAPTHVLVVTIEHHRDVAELVAADPGLAAELLGAASAVAAEQGLAATGYRVLTNVGRDAGQDIPHVHLHVLGGRRMTWPPG